MAAEAYQVKRNLLASRGYASSEELDLMAAEQADEWYGPSSDTSELVKNLRLFSGLTSVQANFEAYDPRLD